MYDVTHHATYILITSEGICRGDAVDLRDAAAMSAASDGAPGENAELRLHDSREQFERNPRTFTTFTLRNHTLEAAHRGSPSWQHIFPFVARHLRRIREDTRAMGIGNETLHAQTTSQAAPLLREEILRYVEPGSPQTSLKVRLIADSESLLLHLTPVREIEKPQPIRLWPFAGERFLATRKSTMTVVSVEAQHEAHERGFDEALLIAPEDSSTSPGGTVLEAAWANIFWITHRGEIATTTGPILPGIIRSVLCSNFPVVEKELSLSELVTDASEIFLTRSTTGIVPVGAIGPHEIAPVPSVSSADRLTASALARWLETHLDAEVHDDPSVFHEASIRR